MAAMGFEAVGTAGWNAGVVASSINVVDSRWNAGVVASSLNVTVSIGAGVISSNVILTVSVGAVCFGVRLKLPPWKKYDIARRVRSNTLSQYSSHVLNRTPFGPSMASFFAFLANR